MDQANLLRIHEPRCSVCRLVSDEEVLRELHRERLEDGLPFADLAAKYGRSESSIRRHMANHAAVPEDSPISGPAASDEALDTPSTERPDEVDAHDLLEGGTKTLFEVVKMLEAEYRTTAQRSPQAAQRVVDKLLKAHALLARSVKQLEEGRTVREEFRKTVPEIVQGITAASIRSTLPLVRQYTETLRAELAEYVNGRVGADELLKRLLRYEAQAPQEVAARMKAAMTEALRIAEAKV